MKPKISFVLITPETIERLKGTLASLQKQTIASTIEVIIVCKINKISPHTLQKFSPYFWGIKTVERQEINNITSACACALPYVSTDITAFLEDHVYIQEDYAANLLQAHQGPWVAVGPNFQNANPGNSWSWSNLLMYYGNFVEREKSERVYTLPMSNISFKTKVLQSYGKKLVELMRTWSGGLNDDLLKNNHQFYFESNAIIYHRNFVQPSLLMKMALAGGQIYGSQRAKIGNWSFFRRILYVLGSPLFPFIRFYKIKKELSRNPRLVKLVFKHSIPLFIQLVFDAIGQAKGYLFGINNASDFINQSEMQERTDITPDFKPVLTLINP